jgi:apolipoprotein D and lipocalin family protein
MKTGWLGIAGALVLTLAAGTPAAQAQSEVVKLDYLRYEGRYYEIARLPTFMQRNCAADTVMTFLRRVDGDVSIVYQCFAEDRSWIVDIGLLEVGRGEQAPGELYVRADLIGWTPWQRGSYRLIEAPEDLSYAIIGSVSGSELWILSRTRQMSEATYQRLVARAAQRGFDTSKLVRNVQNGL